MDIKTTGRWGDMPEGTVVFDVKPNGRYSWRGLWCSMCGSHLASVPKRLCKVLTTERKRKKV